MQSIDMLCWASSLGALIGGGAYVWGYVLKSKGTRRLHTLSLLFTGFGLANLPVVLRNGGDGPALLNGAVVVGFMLAGMVCQALTAFRGRRGDRRAERPATAEEAIAVPAAQPQAGRPIAA
jgi:hypothetical protein